MRNNMRRWLPPALLAVLALASNAIAAPTTTYEIWYNTSNSPSGRSLLGETSNTYFDHTSATPGVTYYYWVKVKTTDTATHSNGRQLGAMQMRITLTCPTTAVRGQTSPVTVQVEILDKGYWDATGDIVVRVYEYDPQWFDPVMGTDTVHFDYALGPFSWIFSYDIDIGAYETWTDTAEVYAWAEHRDTEGILVPLVVDTENDHLINVALLDVPSSPPASVQASDGTYTDRVRITWNSASGNSDFGSVDSGYRAVAGISLPEAVDTVDCGYPITTGGNANWFGQAVTYYYGNDAAQSGAISHSQESWMQMTVSGQGQVSFYWKVSSESGYDYLEFYVDGTRQDRISGSVNWTQKTVTVSGTGTHTLKWRYMKDGSVNSGSDCGWVDKVLWTAAPHTVNTPSTPTGPSSGVTNTSYTYTTGGSSCSWGHSVEYQFDWGDGSQSTWGSSSRSKSWSSASGANPYSVRARARCTSDTSIVSGWSGGKPVTIVYAPIVSSITPSSGPQCSYVKIEGQHFGSAVGTVYFSPGTPAAIISWADNVIYCRAADEIATGQMQVGTAASFFAYTTFTATTPGIIYVSNTTNVPGIENGTTTYPFSTVQRGIDAASNGAEVVVAQGTYVENISFLGKAITVRSTNPDNAAVVAATIIDGNQAGSVVRFNDGEGHDSVLAGLTIQNGKSSEGGGIYCNGTSPTIEKNVITGNTASDDWGGWGRGGGVFCYASSLTVEEGWEASGWTTVFQGDVTISTTGWHTFDFQVPFEYNGIDNLLVDFSFNNSSYTTDGFCRCSSPGGVRSIYYRTDSGYGDPLNWSGTSSPTPQSSGSVPNIRLGPAPVVTVGTSESEWQYPLATFYHDARTQTIYLASELGGPRQFSSLALDVTRVPGQTLNNWTIRVKHISRSDYALVSSCAPVIRNNILVGNTAGGALGEWSAGYGGGIYCSRDSLPTIQNNTIVRNSALGTWGSKGGGIYCEGAQAFRQFDFLNCIIWENSAQEGREVAADAAIPVTLQYCDVKGAISPSSCSGAVDWGEGNLDVEPHFADLSGGDYHLKSQAGRWDPGANGGAGGWVVDNVTSPCIDAGDRASEYTNEPSPNGGRVNMGAYGNTAFASKSVPAPVIATALPDSGPHYTLMKITGSWFGFAEGTVEVGGTPLNILAWSDTEVRCEVPPETTSGPLVVKRLNGVESNVLAFTVTDPDIIYVDDDNTSGIENGTQTWPFSTIQRAILAATDGDTVIVAEGHYDENVDFLGKAITVRSADPDDSAVVPATVIDGGGRGSTVRFVSDEGSDSVLRGFTIQGGSGTDHYGGGIYCDGTSPTIEKNRIIGNVVQFHGGGVYCKGGSPTIQDNVVASNVARWFGGGIACWDSTATIIRNTIHGNAAHWYGGGVFVHGPASPTLKNNIVHNNTGSEGGGIACIYQCSPTLENLTVAMNEAERSGGGIYVGWDCSMSALNMIVWGNVAQDGPQLALDKESSLEIAYSNVEGGQVAVASGADCTLTWAGGNIDELPLFASVTDFHLRSTGGRYDPSAGLPPEDPGAWTIDTDHSPSIDTGSPESAYAAELAPNGDRINMGAYGNTPFASKSAAVQAAPPPEVVQAAPLTLSLLPNAMPDKGDAPRLVATVPELGSETSGIRVLTLTFDMNVNVGASAVEVFGPAALNKAKTTYDARSHTLRLEWPMALPGGAYEVRVIADAILSAEGGIPLDGEVWDPSAPESLPSGDGAPGGDARFEFWAKE